MRIIFMISYNMLRKVNLCQNIEEEKENIGKKRQSERNLTRLTRVERGIEG